MTHQECMHKIIRIRSVAEWTKLARQVKAENGGQYPEWWFPKIIQSGFADAILSDLGGSTEMTVSFE